MENNDLMLKMSNLIKIAPDYKFTSKDRFFLLKDREGWSDGFVADFRPSTLETMRAKATLAKTYCLTLNKEEGPTISKVVDEADGNEIVQDIEYRLEDNKALLIGKELKALVEPKFLKLFFDRKTFKFAAADGLVLTKNLKAVKVLAGENIVGLIMPCRDPKEVIVEPEMAEANPVDAQGKKQKVEPEEPKAEVSTDVIDRFFSLLKRVLVKASI